MAKRLTQKVFHSKLLLFGEQIINKGATGLAIPIEQFNGVLKFADVNDRKWTQSNKSLESLANYIIYHEQLRTQYDTNRFLDDVEKGLVFDSNIPQGYGLGSSGALVAAVYEQYYQFKKKNRPISELKNELALLESHYHGKSSGLDALVCALNEAVIIEKGEVSKAFNLKQSENKIFKLFLINTHIERKTAPYVNTFLERCKEKKFMSILDTSLIPANNIAVDAFLHLKYVDLWKSLKVISQVQFDLLPDFIPRKFHDVWQQGLRTDQYVLKLCGAGGGGFIIGFAKADVNLPTLIGALDTVDIMKF